MATYLDRYRSDAKLYGDRPTTRRSVGKTVD
jgi:hypothetical protein